jgi:hypothetical protein
MNKLKKFVVATIAIIVALPLIVLSYGLETNLTEESYIQKVRSYNRALITERSDEELIKLGYISCTALSNGKDAKGARDAVIFNVKGRKETVNVYGAIIVVVSVDTFCPEYKNQTEDWIA